MKGWALFRLFLMPFCVSNFSSLVKGRGFNEEKQQASFGTLRDHHFARGKAANRMTLDGFEDGGHAIGGGFYQSTSSASLSHHSFSRYAFFSL